MTVEIDAQQFSQAIDSLVDGLSGAARDGLNMTLERIAARARSTTTYTDRTGALRNSTQSAGIVEGGEDGELVGVVSFAARSKKGYLYGLAQEYGTRRGVREKRFIRDAIDAEDGTLLESAMAGAFRSAGFGVTR